LPKGAIYQAIRREMLPSWMISRELRHLAKGATKAAGSDMIDFPLAAVGLYVDKIQVDKRVLGYLNGRSGKNPLFAKIAPRAFRSKDLKDVARHLSSWR
jgi:hypothetical protein